VADRCTLHWNHLPDFRAWLAAHGWRVIDSPPGNGFEVLRARHPDQQHPVIFYARFAKGNDRAPSSASIHLPEASAQALFIGNPDVTQLAQHLTSHGRGPGLVRRFLNDRKVKVAAHG